jgi:pyridine nucleotide-disulfide oxidoreductase family protein
MGSLYLIAMEISMKNLVLIGAGHGHLAVLKRFAEDLSVGVNLIVITPNVNQTYSGMVPGWIAGHYDQAQCQISLPRLFKAASATVVEGYATRIDADTQQVLINDEQVVHYDWLSVDVGSPLNSDPFVAIETKLVSIKPLDRFFNHWPDCIKQLDRKSDHVCVVGAGAAGVELAFAILYALRALGNKTAVTLLGSQQGLSMPSVAVEKRVRQELKKQGIRLVNGPAQVRDDGALIVAGDVISADLVVLSSGAVAPRWLKNSNLALDEQGYIAVNAFHQSTSHSNVFAVGDVASRQDRYLAKSGVHAVRSGPILADNLFAMFDKEPLQPYHPRNNTLYLISCGKQYAIGSWGPFSFSGRWVWWLKDFIDRRFVNGHSTI